MMKPQLHDVWLQCGVPPLPPLHQTDLILHAEGLHLLPVRLRSGLDQDLMKYLCSIVLVSIQVDIERSN